MNPQKFLYVSYIRTTPERLWEALTSSAFTQQYWMGNTVESDWKVGSTVKFRRPGGAVNMSGKILASEKPKVLSYTWTMEMDEQMRAEKPSRVTFVIERYEPNPAVVKLTVTHDDFPEASKVFQGINAGWPMVLGSLKTLLESGNAISFEGTCGK